MNSVSVRADLFALYYILDPKLVELGVIPNLDVGRCEYNSYFQNGLLKQLVRLRVGDNVEEAHMRNRQMIAKWVLHKAEPSGAVRHVERVRFLLSFFVAFSRKSCVCFL